MNPRNLAFLALASVTVLSAPAFADDLASAKAGMRERVPAIDKLKLAGSVGEDNRGYLAVRSPSDEAAAVVAAENADRRIVFSDTAARTGATLDAVGRAFARQIAAASAPGVWVQRADGQWYRK